MMFLVTMIIMMRMMISVIIMRMTSSKCWYWMDIHIIMRISLSVKCGLFTQTQGGRGVERVVSVSLVIREASRKAYLAIL